MYSKRNHLVNSLKLLIGASQSELEYKSMSVNEPAEYVDRAWDLGMVWGFSGQECGFLSSLLIMLTRDNREISKSRQPY